MSEEMRLDAINRLKIVVFKLSGLLLEENEEYLATFGLTPSRARVLGVLIRAKKALTVPEITHEMGQTRQGIGRLVTLMAEDGFVEFATNPRHRKSSLVNCTDQGLRIYQQVALGDHEITLKRGYPLSLTEMEETTRTLAKLANHLESLPLESACSPQAGNERQ